MPDRRFHWEVPEFLGPFPLLWSGHDEVHHHYRRYTRRLLRQRLESAGFRVGRVTYFNTLLFPAARWCG